MAKRPNKSWQDFVPDLNNVIPDAGKDWIPNWDDITNAIPDKGDIADLVPDGEDLYDFLDDLNQWLPDIDAEDYIPSDIRGKLGDLADDIADLMALGYDNIVVKGNYIDPWTNKTLDYAVFNLVVPTSGEVFTEGSKKNNLMSGHWEKHKYEGGNGNDKIFTWHGKDHLYADGDDCTMISGKGTDFFYLDGDATATIKDYRKKGKDIIRVDGFNNNQVKVQRKGGDSFIKSGRHTLAKVMGVNNLKASELQFSGENNRRIEPDDLNSNGYSQQNLTEEDAGDALKRLITPVSEL